MSEPPASTTTTTSDDPGRTVLLSLAELAALHALVLAKIEGAIVHSAEYFALEDLAHKLSTASQPRAAQP